MSGRSFIWGSLAAIALLWPDRLGGPFDGVPLDRAAEAVALGVLFPALWWWHPRFLSTRPARGAIVVLLCWKAFASVALVQDGWCARFLPGEPLVKDGAGAPHSWDLRADWRSDDPACSAIVARPYNDLSEFPAWFFNLPPPNDSWPGPRDRPPGASLVMTVDGFLHNRDAGTLLLPVGADLTEVASVDGQSVSGDGAHPVSMTLMPGTHALSARIKLAGDLWGFTPQWNGRDLWSASSIATVSKPSSLDVALRPWAGWAATAIVALLLIGWIVFAAAEIRDPDVLAWTAGASGWMIVLAATGHVDLARWSVVGLAGAALVPVSRRRRNLTGALALIGIPWLSLIVASGLPLIGHFRLYDFGHDYWMFQRFSYRIFMQGYWLEGGSPTFWFQPLYRWIAGALHMVFGDSSVGERFWDGACMLVTSMFAFHVVKTFAGFRWGLVSATMTLAMFAVSPLWSFVGLGLSESSSAGLMYLAAMFALRSRHGSRGAAIAAGLVAVLAFYTRLNNLPMAFGLALFALPLRQPVSTLVRPAAWWPRVSRPAVAGIVAALCLGLLLFAWRTWYYTGVFSVIYGTQATSLVLWQPGMPVQTGLERVADSAMMVLTMNDPPHFEMLALPLFAGVAMSILAVLGVPWLRELPLGPVLFCLAAISGSLVARGASYPGRFSIHMVAICCTVVTCAAALLTQKMRNPVLHPRARAASAPPIGSPR